MQPICMTGQGQVVRQQFGDAAIGLRQAMTGRTGLLQVHTGNVLEGGVLTCTGVLGAPAMAQRLTRGCGQAPAAAAGCDPAMQQPAAPHVCELQVTLTGFRQWQACDSL